ncbi:MAG: hypothetical protein ACR2O6_15905, partial [Ilumatobacteraceae bacterium]
MNLEVVVLIASTAAGLAGIAVLAGGSAEPVEVWSRSRVAGTRGLLVGTAAGGMVFVLSGWIVPAVITAAAAGVATRTWQQRDRRANNDVERTEALASWIENLRDVLIAGDQPIGAINATVPTCPAPIRRPVRRLAAGLGR